MIVENTILRIPMAGSLSEGLILFARCGYLLVTSVVAGISLRHYSDKINHLGDLVVIETIKG